MFKIRPIPEDVDDLKKKIKEAKPHDLGNCDADRLKVYAAGGDPRKDEPLRPGKEVKTLGDTTDENPLIVVAPATTQLQQQQQQPTQPPIKTYILGEGVVENSKLAVFYSIDKARKTVGTRFLVRRQRHERYDDSVKRLWAAVSPRMEKKSSFR